MTWDKLEYHTELKKINLSGYLVCLAWNPDLGPNDMPSWVDFALYEEVTKSDNGVPGYQVSDDSGYLETTENYEEALPVAQGFMKWDGCTQFSIEPLHYDDHRDIAKLFDTILQVRRECARITGNDAEDEYK